MTTTRRRYDAAKGYAEYAAKQAKKATKPLTIDDIEAGYDNPEWGGYGYLSEREHAGRTRAGAAQMALADAAILEEANSRGWTPAQFFYWLNSKDGRWFGEEALGRAGVSIIKAAHYAKDVPANPADFEGEDAWELRPHR